jgi:hypothetical protein
MQSFRRVLRSMVFVGLPPGTAELIVTTIYVFIVIITLSAIRGGEGRHGSHGRKSDRDDKKRSHESFSRFRAGTARLHPKGERRPVRGWVAPTRPSFHPTVQRPQMEVIAARYVATTPWFSTRRVPTASARPTGRGSDRMSLGRN